jgi:MSHA biogenesis protein MshQ
VRIVKGGTIGTKDLSTTTGYTTTVVTEAHGSAAELWGQTWTAADVNLANFGAAFSAARYNLTSTGSGSRTVSVDAISIIVNYADSVPPVVSSIAIAGTSPTAASQVSWNVNFSKSVSPVVAADFSLVQSGGVSGASIASVTGGGTSWVVTANTGIGSGTLGLNLNDHDTIKDASGNLLGGTGTGVAGGGGTGNGSFSGAAYTIDRLNPVVNSFTLTSPNVNQNSSSLSWTVTFSQSVSNIRASDFVTVTGGTVANGAISVSASNGTSTVVTVAGISGTGNIALNLVDHDTIINSVSTPLGGAGQGNGNASGPAYTIDTVAPSVVSISCDAGSTGAINQVSWTVTFSEPVKGLTLSNFSLAASGLAGSSLQSVTAIGSGVTVSGNVPPTPNPLTGWTSWSVTADTGYGAGSLGLNLANGTGVSDNPMANSLSTAAYTGATCAITSTPPLANYRMDEVLWNGTTDEVVDQMGATPIGNPGTAVNGATTADVVRAIAGTTGTCRYGQFYTPTTTKAYVDLTVNFPYLTDDFTLAGWVKTPATADMAVTKQWIFTHNTGGKGYALSLGDAGSGKLRFLSGSAPTTLASPSALTAATWYFVAVVLDFSAAPSVKRTLYVFNSSGALVSGYPVSVLASDWDDTEAGAASIGGDGTNSFRGNLDEIQIFSKVLNQSALASLAQAVHPCGAVSLDHLEIQSAAGAGGLTCAANTLTIRACMDAAVPCNSLYTGGVTGSLSATGISTVNWDGTTGGATSNGFVIPSGAGTITKNVQVAAAGTAVFGATPSSPTATNSTSCSFGSPACSFAANTAGFLFTSNATGTIAYAVPAQVAGISSATMYLRALDSAKNPAVCTPAIISQAVDTSMYYGCNNPSSCQSGNLATINATAINSSSLLPNSVTLNFDANGSAPMVVRYDDVGQITLNARKIAIPFVGSTNITLSGSSNSFVVAPHHFGFSAVTPAPIKAGNNFAATVTAYNGLGTPGITGNFGQENAVSANPEGVSLSFTKCQPTFAGSVNGSFSGSVGTFSAGSATSSNLNWSDVGIGDLVATLTSASYLGSGLSASGNTDSGGTVCNGGGIVGRFIPNHFDTAITAMASPVTPINCPTGVNPATGVAWSCPVNALGVNGLVYASQPFTVQVTARNAAGTTTSNYQGSYAKATALSAWNARGASGGANANPGGGTMSNASLAASAFTTGVGTTPVLTLPSYALSASTMPTDIFVRAIDADNVSSLQTTPANSVEAGVKVATGRTYIPGVYGSNRLPLPLPITVQFYNGSYWATSLTDNAMSFNNALSTAGGNVLATQVSGPAGCISVNNPNVTTHVVSGVRSLSIAASSTTCSYNLSLNNAPTYLPVFPVNGGRATFGLFKSPLIYRRENY